jgi:hypothetical protein
MKYFFCFERALSVIPSFADVEHQYLMLHIFAQNLRICQARLLCTNTFKIRKAYELDRRIAFFIL